MVLNLSGPVINDMLEKLTRALNELKDGETLHIYFSTPGGEVSVAEAIINIINTNKDKITMIFYGEVFSAGMMVFLRTNVTKSILPETSGMYHFSWQDMTISEGGKPNNEYDKFSYNQMKKSMDKTIEFLKTTKIDEKDINKIKRGKDVYFSYEKMLELNVR